MRVENRDYSLHALQRLPQCIGGCTYYRDLAMESA